LTKASLYVYFGPVAVLVCSRFDLSLLWPVVGLTTPHLNAYRTTRWQNQLAVSQLADWITRRPVNSPTANF